MAKLFQWTRWRPPWLKCRSARLKQAHLLPLVVIVSDGEANIPLLRKLATAMERRYQHIRDLHSERLFDMLRSSKNRDNTKNEME